MTLLSRLQDAPVDTRTATALAILRTGGSYQDAAESSGLTVREVMTAYQASRVTATLNAEYRVRKATTPAASGGPAALGNRP